MKASKVEIRNWIDADVKVETKVNSNPYQIGVSGGIKVLNSGSVFNSHDDSKKQADRITE